MPLSAGDTIGPYTILDKLGEGGMGEVFKARDTRLGRIVALKSLPAASVSDPNRRQRFLQEAQAASALNHPNIITVYDWLEHNNSYILVMEYVPGKTLDHLIPKKGLRLNDILKYATQIADALAAAHAHGIIHRDIKPANIMVTPEGRVKVLDFGLAKLTELLPAGENEATLTARAISEEGTVAGSAPYMSPEQAEGKKIDARSDIFSFGAVLYEMLTGQRAFQGDSRVSTMAAILKSEPKPASQLAEVLPKELDRILSRCLRKDVDRRSQSIAEIKLELEELREESESGLQPAAAPPAHSKRPIAWMVLAALIISGAVVFLYFRNQTPTSTQYTLRQITRDDSISNNPAVSPDGKFIVYSSTRGGQPDLWIQRTSGGEPIRLTNTPLAESLPNFSPDGSLIAYTRELPGGKDIAIIPSIGGAERQLVRVGWGPRFSPDGSLVAYSTGTREIPQTNSMWVVSSAGGPPRELNKGDRGSGDIVWSQDGSHLLVADNASSRRTFSTYSWYLLPLTGGAVIPVVGMERLRDSVHSLYPVPIAWLPSGNQVVFGTVGPEANIPHIWSVGLTSQGKLDNSLRQITNGTGELPGASSADGKVIPFSSTSMIETIYSVPLDANRAVVTGAPRRILQTDALSSFPTVSADGTKLAYISDRSGNNDIWIRDLTTGEDTLALASPEVETRGIISPDASKLAVFRLVSGNHVAYWMTLPSGQLNKICDDCRSLIGWTPDGSQVVVSQGQPEHMVLYDIATGKRSPTAVHPKYPIHNVIFSPDGRWFAFKLIEAANKVHLVVSPAAAGRPTEQSQWIYITSSKLVQRLHWSPDGNALYFYAPEGHRGDCLFAHRLDPVTKQPRGDDFPVFHAPENLSVPFTAKTGYGLTSTQLYVPLTGVTSQIWVAEALTGK